jgi:hypothetical protein
MIPVLDMTSPNEKGGRMAAFLRQVLNLRRANVLCLPALGSLHDVELNRLPLLEAAETVRLDGGEMDENVLAILAADKSKTLSVVEPLYCSLFHFAYCSFLIDVREKEGWNYWAALVLLQAGSASNNQTCFKHAEPLGSYQ